MFNHGHLGEFVRQQKKVRENRDILATEPVKDFDRFLDLDSARDEKKRAGTNEGLMQRGKFG